VSHARARSVAMVLGVLGWLTSPVLVAPSASANPLSAAAAAATVTASLVRTVATSTLSPPIPDPAGITYLPSRDRLLISDSEVDEVSIYAGSNLFETTRAGILTDRGVTTAYTKEAAGVGHNPANGHIFVSDDDQFRVYEVVAGPDNRYGTTDDTRTFINTAAFGSTDPEDVEYFPPTGELFVLDGADHDVHRVSPGPNGVFDGVAPTGDDTASEFDVQMYGAEDPEGIGFYPGRNTLLVVDSTSDSAYEVNRNVMLLNRIDISASNQLFAAGITVAPATNDPNRMDLYIVDRGVDNDSDPNENDGKLHEMSVPLPPIGNLAPMVDVGRDKPTHVGDPVALNASVRDDGLPTPTTTVSWSTVSGPGTVSFSAPNAPQTSAVFSAGGTYVLRATASDTALTGSDELTVTVVAAGAPLPLDTPVAKAFDDVEQRPTGFTDWLGSTLNVPNSGGTTQTVGIRFDNLEVPKNATITEAWIQFTSTAANSGATSVQIRGVAADDTPTFTTSSTTVTSRPRTQASATWTPPAWTGGGQAGAAQRTSDLRSVVQEIVGRTGWNPGNALAFVLSGSGERRASSHDGSVAPVLHLAYTTPGGGNSAPTAAFTSSCSGLTCNFDGTGSSDPDGPIVSYQWNFGDTTTGSGGQPTHAYEQAGTYNVSLTVTDGNGATDSVSHQVTVSSTTSPIAFRGMSRFVGNTTSAALTVPASVQPGDALVLFATLNTTTTSVSGPSGVTGWTPLTNFVTGSARTMVWRKVAVAGDGGKGLTLSLSTFTKVNLQLVAYDGTSTADPVATFATRSDPASTVTHPTPTVSVTNGGSWLLSYWADKSSLTTDWSAPSGAVVRDELVGTGGGHIGSLVADSGAAVSTGTAGGLTATTDAASRAATVSIVLSEPTATATAATEATTKSETEETTPKETAKPETKETTPKETAKPETKETTPKETAKPKTAEAVHVTKRQWAKVVKNPDAYEGKRYIIYGQVTEFDPATDPDRLLADTAHKDSTSSDSFDGKATLLTGDEADLSNLVADDVFRATVTVIGSSAYDARTGRNTTVPHLEVNKLKVVGNNG
jgi:PKD repeat protein